MREHEKSVAEGETTERIRQRDVLRIARHYFDKGRCSGHDQFNGRYCRDAADPERWCIHCSGLLLLQQLEAAEARADALQAWKQSQQSALLKMAAELLDAGFKGDGVVEGLEWLKARADAAEHANERRYELWAAAADERDTLRTQLAASEQARASLAQEREELLAALVWIRDEQPKESASYYGGETFWALCQRMRGKAMTALATAEARLPSGKE